MGEGLGMETLRYPRSEFHFDFVLHCVWYVNVFSLARPAAPSSFAAPVLELIGWRFPASPDSPSELLLPVLNRVRGVSPSLGHFYGCAFSPFCFHCGVRCLFVCLRFVEFLGYMSMVFIKL